MAGNGRRLDGNDLPAPTGPNATLSALVQRHASCAVHPVLRGRRGPSDLRIFVVAGH